MSEKLLDNAQLYRKMQSTDLAKRLEREKIVTRGHMPELRGRLLRLEAVKNDETECCTTRVRAGMKRPVIVNEKWITDERELDRMTEDRRICRSDGKSYTEEVLNGAAEALSRMLSTISENDFFDSMAAIRSAEKRPKTKYYSRLGEND